MPIFPYIPVPDAHKALAFYETAFGADVFHKVRGDAGRIGHARFRIEDAVVMLYEYTDGELPGIVPPTLAGATTVTLRVLLGTRDAVDRIFRNAKAEGARIVLSPYQAPWDEYYGRLSDPFGHAWAFGALTETQGDKSNG